MRAGRPRHARDEVFEYLNSASDNRARARELARAIQGVRGAAVGHPAIERAERCLSLLETRSAVLEITEADVAAIADALADGADFRRERASPVRAASEGGGRVLAMTNGQRL